MADRRLSKTCQNRCEMLPRQHADVSQPDFLITLLVSQLQVRESVQYTNWECRGVMLFDLANGLYVPALQTL